MKTIITFAVAGLVALLIAVLGTLTFVKWREAAQATQRASRAIEQGQAARERISALEEEIVSLREKLSMAIARAAESVKGELTCTTDPAAPSDAARGTVTLEPRYKPGVLRLVLQKEGLRVDAAPGSVLQIGDTAYELNHYLFVPPTAAPEKGRAPMPTLLLVHRAASGQWAIVAVPMRESAFQNRSLWLILNNLPPKGSTEASAASISVDPMTLLPPSLDHQTWEAALPMPPCTAGARWLRFTSPIGISREQAEKLVGRLHGTGG
jgi:carbonic anhydrase